MRIISKYHDYYDTAMAHGIDPSLIYKRELESVEVCEMDWAPGAALEEIWRTYPWSGYLQGLGHLTLLLFCGKVYPYWFSRSLTDSRNILTAAGLEERAKELYKRRQQFATVDWRGPLTGDPFFVSLDDLTEFLGKDDHPSRMGPAFCRKNVSAYAERVTGTPIDHSGHHFFRSPTLLVARAFSPHGPKRYAVVRNPVLKDLDFQKVMDPFTAFQEIAMFLGGVMAAEDRAPQRVGSDEVIARQKGFDEWSFRTQAPGQKKLNRKANRARKRGEAGE